MLLCAGRGTRLESCGLDVPKCMVPIGGKPILEHTIEWLVGFDIRRLVINLHHLPDRITEHFGDGQRFGVDITYSYEEEPLGTAGAVKKVASLFDRTFVVWYGDNFGRCRLDRLHAVHQQTAALVTTTVFEREDVLQSGIVGVASDGRVERFVEKPRPDEVFSHLVNAGIMVVEPTAVELIPAGQFADFARDLLPELLRRGLPVGAHRMDPDERLWWIDTPADLARTRADWEKSQAL